MAMAKSLYLYQKTSKIDYKDIMDKYKFNYKFDYLTLIFVTISLILIILGFFFPICFFISIPFIFLAFFTNFKFTNKKRPVLLKHIEDSIVNMAKSNNAIPISAIYPVFLYTDNTEKRIKITYQNETYLDVKYSNIIGYNIYCDRVKVNGHLPKNPNKKVSSYVLEILFDNNTKIEIGLSNVNKYFILGKGFTYNQFSNTRTINFLATVIDKIKNKNNV